MNTERNGSWKKLAALVIVGVVMVLLWRSNREEPSATAESSSIAAAAKEESALPVVVSIPAGQAAELEGHVSIDRLILGTGAVLKAPSLTEVTGWITVGDDAILMAPRLRSCGGLGVGRRAGVAAPELVSVANVVIGEGARIAAAAPKLKRKRVR